MSNGSRWASVCKPENSFVFDAQDFSAPATPVTESAVDRYLKATRVLLQIAGSVVGPAALPLLPPNVGRDAGRLLLLGLVSETERYFRDVLARLLDFCPLCARCVEQETVKVTAVLPRRMRSVGLGLFDEVSFSSSQGIMDQTSRVLGLKIKAATPLYKCLADFGKLCNFRHAAVHSGGEMAEHNAVAVGLDPALAYCLVVDFSGFSRATEICHNLVRAYNLTIYRHIIQKWMERSWLHGTWQQDKFLFKQLYALFYSKIDAVGPLRADLAYRSLRATILKVANATSGA